MQPGRERRRVTAALMLGIILTAVEATGVSAAMPTAASELGGVERYSWIFTAYLLTSTIAMPLYGKLADLYGRRRIFQTGISLFLLGSMLCGTAPSMTVLIVFRAIQGLGAGGLMPLTATIAADIYPLAERGQMQGLFAGTWTVAALLGPLGGGWITDTFSWRWIFYLTIPAGVLSIALVGRYLREVVEPRRHALDVLGALSLMVAVISFLVALTEGTSQWGRLDPRTLALYAASAAGLATFLWQERRAAEPILPLDIFGNRQVSVASVGNVLLGMLFFSLSTYIPIFGQGVLGGTAIDAGSLLIPLSLGWTLSSTVGGRMLLRMSYRAFLLWGASVATGGCVFLALVDAESSRWDVMRTAFFIGLGLGWVSLPYLIGVQNAVPKERRGVVTSTVQFFRFIGGAVAVAALGALFQARQSAASGGLDVEAALNPELRAHLDPQTLKVLQGALLHALDGVFVALTGIAVAVFLCAAAYPRGSAEELAWRGLHRFLDADSTTPGSRL